MCAEHPLSRGAPAMPHCGKRCTIVLAFNQHQKPHMACYTYPWLAIHRRTQPLRRNTAALLQQQFLCDCQDASLSSIRLITTTADAASCWWRLLLQQRVQQALPRCCEQWAVQHGKACCYTPLIAGGGLGAHQVADLLIHTHLNMTHTHDGTQNAETGQQHSNCNSGVCMHRHRSKHSKGHHTRHEPMSRV